MSHADSISIGTSHKKLCQSLAIRPFSSNPYRLYPMFRCFASPAHAPITPKWRCEAVFVLFKEEK